MFSFFFSIGQGRVTNLTPEYYIHKFISTAAGQSLAKAHFYPQSLVEIELGTYVTQPSTAATVKRCLHPFIKQLKARLKKIINHLLPRNRY